MNRRQVITVATSTAAAAVVGPALIGAAWGLDVPWAWLGVVGVLELAAAGLGAGFTYDNHRATQALSWRVALLLSHLPGVSVWAVQQDRSIVFSVGGVLRRYWSSVAPDGIMPQGMTLDDFPHEERDRHLAVAWETGRAAWVADMEGVTWLSWAKRVKGVLIVLTVDATLVARYVRDRILASAEGGTNADRG